MTAAHSENAAKKKRTAVIITVCSIVIVTLLLIVLLWKNGIFGSDSSERDAVNVDAPIKDDDEELSNPDQSDVEESEINNDETKEPEQTTEPDIAEKTEEDLTDKQETPQSSEEIESIEDTTQSTVPEKPADNPPAPAEISQPTITQPPVSTPVVQPKDIYGYLKNFVIQNGIINGDYCYYSNDADNYGGYASERFSLYYWGDTEKIEFCLHSVLDDMFSINFYLYVPKTHTGKYEYISSYYYRDTGESVYEAKGVINAEEFTKNYPLNCTRYIGSTSAQNDFMEISRQGICDLIDCIRNFIAVENIPYSFYDFGFVKF